LQLDHAAKTSPETPGLAVGLLPKLLPAKKRAKYGCVTKGAKKLPPLLPVEPELPTTVDPEPRVDNKQWVQ
jgi:hypothetical protein